RPGGDVLLQRAAARRTHRDVVCRAVGAGSADRWRGVRRRRVVPAEVVLARRVGAGLEDVVTRSRHELLVAAPRGVDLAENAWRVEVRERVRRVTLRVATRQGDVV